MFSKFIQKYKNTPIHVRASLWYTVCSILQKGISFLIVPIYVRLLTTSEYGQYSVFQSWKEILIIFATLNLYCGVFTKAMVDYKDDRDRYTSSMQTLSTLITLAMVIVYLLNHRFWENVLSMNTFTMILMFLYFIFYPAFSFWSVRQRVENKYVIMVVVTLFVSIFTPTLSIILLNLTNLRENALIYGYLFSQIMVGAFFYIRQYIRCPIFVDIEYWKRGLKFNIPLIPHYLSLIILGQSDRIMIEHFCGSDKVAIYNLAYQISMVVNVIISALNNALVPWTYEKLRIKKYDDIKKTMSIVCLGIAICIFAIIILSPELILILGTEEYLEAIWIIPAIGIGCYFTYCYGLFSSVEFYFGKTTFVTIASTIGALLNVVLNAIFIPIFGYMAAGYTTMVCYLVFVFMHYFFMKKICIKETNDIIPYNMSFIVLSCLALCVAGLIFMVIHQFRLIRFAIVFVLMIYVYINRQYMIKILKKEL